MTHSAVWFARSVVWHWAGQACR